MADRRGLRLVGFAYCGVVVIVALIALVVVMSHVNTAVEARPDPLIASAR
jgi:fumarate reductase subunit C